MSPYQKKRFLPPKEPNREKGTSIFTQEKPGFFEEKLVRRPQTKKSRDGAKNARVSKGGKEND